MEGMAEQPLFQSRTSGLFSEFSVGSAPSTSTFFPQSSMKMQLYCTYKKIIYLHKPETGVDLNPPADTLHASYDPTSRLTNSTPRGLSNTTPLTTTVKTTPKMSITT